MLTKTTYPINEFQTDKGKVYNCRVDIRFFGILIYRQTLIMPTDKDGNFEYCYKF